MSHVIAAPDTFAAAAADVTRIGSSISAAHVAAAAPTTALVAAAGDEVSVAISSLFSGYAKDFQAVSAQASSFHARFVQALTGAGGAYAAAEATNVLPLQAAQSALAAAQSTPLETVQDGLDEESLRLQYLLSESQQIARANYLRIFNEFDSSVTRVIAEIEADVDTLLRPTAT